MGKKPQRHSWPEAKKLCRLNQQDIEMAKRLGFGPDALIRARPDPKQKWKLPVKYWVHELYAKRFGEVLGEKPLPAAPTPWVYDEEAARRFEEELYWEDYWARNEEPAPVDTRKPRVIAKPDVTPSRWPALTDDDVPF